MESYHHLQPDVLGFIDFLPYTVLVIRTIFDIRTKLLYLANLVTFLVVIYIHHEEQRCERSIIRDLLDTKMFCIKTT